MNEEKIQLSTQEKELLAWFRNIENDGERKEWQNFLELAYKENIAPHRLTKVLQELLLLKNSD